MLAYNENGLPLKLYWNFLDSSAESSFENIVRTKTNILPNQTEEYRGGWSLYDGEIMEDFPNVGNGEANQVAYSLFCLKQVVLKMAQFGITPTMKTGLRRMREKK